MPQIDIYPQTELAVFSGSGRLLRVYWLEKQGIQA
jgi:hypothetical protein